MAIVQSRMSGVQLDVRRISEKYLTCNKRKTSGHLPKLGARCPIMQSVASLTRSWTSGVWPDVHGMSEKYLSHNIFGLYRCPLSHPHHFIHFWPHTTILHIPTISNVCSPLETSPSDVFSIYLDNKWAFYTPWEAIADATSGLML